LETYRRAREHRAPQLRVKFSVLVLSVVTFNYAARDRAHARKRLKCWGSDD